MSPPDRSRHSWENIIKADFEKGKYVRDWILSARYKFQLLTCKPSGFLNSRNFLRI